jgi:hypothetical protein
MDERLIKQWQITKSLLMTAAIQIESSEYYTEYVEFISHNELELALDVLEEAGQHIAVDRDYWWNLKKAAEVMGLDSHLNFLRQQLRNS